MSILQILVSVEAMTVGDDPPIQIYHVELSHGNGIWTETFGSKEQLDAFMKGLQAASGMAGFELKTVERQESEKE